MCRRAMRTHVQPPESKVKGQAVDRKDLHGEKSALETHTRDDVAEEIKSKI